MKASHIATLALLSVSAICSTGGITIAARQFTIERSAVRVVADSTVAARLQGLSDAIDLVPANQRPELLLKYGLKDEPALAAALSVQRRELDAAAKSRAEELAANDKRLTGLLAACGLSAIVAMMAAVTLYDMLAAADRRTHELQPFAQ
ncbi:hypothetical protein IAG25_28435 [Caballeronia sp. EK]|uniref:hypothetical protein n=1 Tax=Caballeronia sp. EK TaxID=2767469 RepID=UPI001656219D|nr:hypothetical protein [Caballeronia sp. EK]MBC8640750.1 hypothetical protein [Caballeronia sp. EK]